MRILLTKIQLTSAASESEQFRRAVKATAVLFPLLGINNLLFLINPGKDYEYYYLIINTILQSTQGIFVSLLYCFICKDVKDAIRREYGRFSARRSANSIRSQSRRGFGTSYRDKLMKRSQRTNEMSASYSRAHTKMTTASMRSERTIIPESPTKIESFKFPTDSEPPVNESPGQVVPLLVVGKVPEHQPLFVNSNGQLRKSSPTNPPTGQIS
ncbi:unnamed protein product, partial [Allacma fusca]